MRNKVYTIGEDTRRFLDLLDTYTAFKEQYLLTLIMEYGEKSGEEMFCNLYDTFEPVEDAIFKDLRNLMVCEMGTGKTEITI